MTACASNRRGSCTRRRPSFRLEGGSMKRLMTVVAVALLFAGCASKPPKWVVKGGNTFKDSGAKVFYGVGAITGVQNRPLAVTAADNPARPAAPRAEEDEHATDPGCSSAAGVEPPHRGIAHGLRRQAGGARGSWQDDRSVGALERHRFAARGRSGDQGCPRPALGAELLA